MSPTKLSSFALATLLLLTLAKAQQSCINTCTDSANVLTQLKTCSGCGTDDWSCFCRCPQYMNALFSCVEENCSGSDVENNIVSFCASQGVTVSYTSGSLSIASNTASSTSTIASSTTGSSATGSQSGSVTDVSELSAYLATVGLASSTSFASSDTSGISAYLASAVPSSVSTESSSACFVNSQYSYYSTPTWYSSLPTQAQSYYSSVNQGNTAACTLSPSQAAALATSSHRRSGLSGGAIAGIVIGSILAALLLAALLLWCCLRRRRRSRRNDAAMSTRSRDLQPKPMSNVPANSQGGYRNGNEGVYRNGNEGAYRNGNEGAYNNGSGGVYRNGNEGLNGLATPSRNQAGPMVGGAAFGTNGQQKQPDHFTSTTTRTVIRSKPRNSAQNNSPMSPTRPPPQPISNHAVNDVPQNIPQESYGRRAF